MPPGSLLIVEPPTGSYIRARYADHHTAAYVFHRDDAEGNPPWSAVRDAEVWWFHEQQKWISWKFLIDFTCNHVPPLVLEQLSAPMPEPGCAWDGSHASCHTPVRVLRCVRPDCQAFGDKDFGEGTCPEDHAGWA